MTCIVLPPVLGRNLCSVGNCCRHLKSWNILHDAKVSLEAELILNSNFVYKSYWSRVKRGKFCSPQSLVISTVFYCFVIYFLMSMHLCPFIKIHRKTIKKWIAGLLSWILWSYNIETHPAVVVLLRIIVASMMRVLLPFIILSILL